ncbi:uncharacterized protein LOC127276941 [Leptopilina boulardi]|uniref:uncharacterized protein LOC127276941 n=1 Tax=Leptopilina boulardi TaxID=63433 RepID=UPI0021F50BFD|nr:uncharacterized protein LOC127276941 [Leptopilina boulardi]
MSHEHRSRKGDRRSHDSHVSETYRRSNAESNRVWVNPKYQNNSYKGNKDLRSKLYDKNYGATMKQKQRWMGTRYFYNNNSGAKKDVRNQSDALNNANFDRNRRRNYQNINTSKNHPINQRKKNNYRGTKGGRRHIPEWKRQQQFQNNLDTLFTSMIKALAQP